ncbi:hypothetical protein [uncultured Selenomonas sp.]|uniref:hypothetical protein n=1 Tax=uncultured Selenomonas sp. TaxID=159275 RepID=UPI0025FF7864|nr:hypothetical protein [uncultured Selenomonas sp.]
MNRKKFLALTLAIASLAAPCAAATPDAAQGTQTAVAPTAPSQTSQQSAAAAPGTQTQAPAAKTADVQPPADIVTWVTPSTATAPCIVGTLAPNQVALGRVHIHDSTDQVVRYWKAATHVSGHGKWLTYTYGQTFGVRFHQGGYSHQDYGVSEVSTIAANGIATPAGIEVGMSDQILQQKYGMPTHLTTAAQQNGYTTTYFYYGYGTELGHELSFDVREGKIIKIRLRSYYEFPQHFYR